jgi:hypothetical protein
MLLNTINELENKLEKFSSENLKSMLCIHSDVSNQLDLTVDDLSTSTSHASNSKLDYVSILASFYVWTKSLKSKDAVNRYSIIQSLQVRRNSSSLSAVRTIEPSRPDAHLSIVPSVRTTCHTVRTLDRPASSVWTKCSFRPDPILYREVSVSVCIHQDVSAACLDASQYSISF